MDNECSALDCAYCKTPPLLDSDGCYRVACVAVRCPARPMRAGGTLQEAVSLWNTAMRETRSVGLRYFDSIEVLRKLLAASYTPGELVEARNAARRIVDEHDAQG